jgi:hypothetical protein
MYSRAAYDYLSRPSRQDDFAPALPSLTARLEARLRAQELARQPDRTGEVVEKVVSEFSGNTPVELRKYARDAAGQIEAQGLLKLQIKMKADERAIEAARNNPHPLMGHNQRESRQVEALTAKLFPLAIAQNVSDEYYAYAEPRGLINVGDRTPAFTPDNQYDGTEFRELYTVGAPEEGSEQSSSAPRYSQATESAPAEEYDQVPTATSAYGEEEVEQEGPEGYSVQSVSPPSASSYSPPSPPQLTRQAYNPSTYFGYQEPTSKTGTGMPGAVFTDESRRLMRLEKAKRGLRLHKYSPLLR